MEGFPGISDFLAAALVVPQQQSANEHRRDSGGFVVVGHPTTTPLLVVRGLWDTQAAPEKMVVCPSGRYEPSDVRAFRRFSRA